MTQQLKEQTALAVDLSSSSRTQIRQTPALWPQRVLAFMHSYAHTHTWSTHMHITENSNNKSLEEEEEGYLK